MADVVLQPFRHAVVFQCKACLTAVSDSTEAVAASQALQAVAVNGVTNCAVREGLHEREQPFHCVGAELACANCGAVVGTLFQQLPDSHAALAGRFCLHFDAVVSYELGCCDVRAGGSQPAGPLVLDGAAGEGGGQQELAARVEQLESDLAKVQQMLLLHSEQLSDIREARGS